MGVTASKMRLKPKYRLYWNIVVSCCHSPPELRVQQDGVNTLTLGTLQHFSVWYSILPLDMEKGPEASHVECVKLFGMLAVDSPRLACMKQGG